MIEDGLRQALLISDGDLAIFYGRPIAMGFLVMTVALVVWITWKNLRAQRRG